MLETLYLKTIEKKDEIQEFFNSITDKIDVERVNKEYNKKEFTKEIQDKNFAAIDGSFNTVKYMVAYVCAFTSQTIISKKNESILKESSTSDIQTVRLTNRKIDKLLSTRMNILELKSTIDTLKKYDDLDYMLMDGSLRGTLMNFQTTNRLNKEIINYINSESIMLDKELEKDEIDVRISSDYYKRLIMSGVSQLIEEHGLNVEIKDIENDIVSYFESLEQLICINYLLRHYKNKIICISKTSTTKNLFKESIPDSAVIEYTCSNAGFTNPMILDLNKLVRYQKEQKISVDYPVHKYEISDNIYTILFTKLESKGNVLKIELPYKMEDREKIIEILNDLKSISVMGYPHILKKAHDEVKISSKYMKRLEVNLGLTTEKTGRDMVN